MHSINSFNKLQPMYYYSLKKQQNSPFVQLIKRANYSIKMFRQIALITIIAMIAIKANTQTFCSTVQVQSSGACSLICDLSFTLKSNSSKKMDRQIMPCGSSILDRCDKLCCNTRQSFNYSRAVDGQSIQDQLRSAVTNFCIFTEENSDFTHVGLIIAIVVISICIFIVLAQIIYSVYKCYCNSGQEQVNAQMQVESAQILNLNDIADNNNPGVVKSRTYLLNPKQQCSICLEQKNNFMTKCGHYFHAECLGKWLDRNAKCPLCQGSDLNPIIVYCDLCNYRAFGLKISKKRAGNEQEMKKFKKNYCQTCKDDLFPEESKQPIKKSKRELGNQQH